MKYLIAVLIVLLIVLHQDFWFWDDDSLVFGFMPIGLFYHACLSIAAAIVWLMVTQFAWPAELDVDEASATVESEPASHVTEGGK